MVVAARGESGWREDLLLISKGRIETLVISNVSGTAMWLDVFGRLPEMR